MDKSIKCQRCNGTGLINSFLHVREGVCFGCNGSGLLLPAKRKTVTYAQAFIAPFKQDSFFPADQTSMKRIVCFFYQDSPTAQYWVLRDKEFYYVGQPICRASIWFKVPINDFIEFLPYYHKARKLQIELPESELIRLNQPVKIAAI